MMIFGLSEEQLGPMILAAVVPLGISIVWLGVTYAALSAPLRRQERARLFLDLLEGGIRDGQSPERTIVDIARTHDRTLGHQFHLLAAYIETGMRLSEAVTKVPKLLPRRVAAMLRQYEHTNNLPAILSACRKLLTDASSRSTRSVNYLIVIFLLSSPAFLVFPTFFAWVIFPKFIEITGELGGGVPFLMRLCMHHPLAILAVQLALLFAVYIAAFSSGATPRVLRWLDPIVKPVTDRLACRLPWRRKRLLWGFSALLAGFLDEGVPEAKAVQLAAAGTDNNMFIQFGNRIVERLQQGVPLTEAMRVLDDSGEFRWRLANAAYGQAGFRTALAGWHEALDAKAFQQEQAASQFVTTGLVILNGVFVALIAISVFQALTSIVWELSLW
jgi:type II secretory pathway component PulF